MTITPNHRMPSAPVVDHPPAPARPTLPMYGGAAGALNARGAEAAARALARVWAAARR